MLPQVFWGPVEPSTPPNSYASLLLLTVDAPEMQSAMLSLPMIIWANGANEANLAAQF